MPSKVSCNSIGRELKHALVRRKTFDKVDMSATKLDRCLSLLDLTAIGIGCTLGAGVYVVVGSVVRNSAGPGVIISFLVAGIASLMAGLCYAEFGARVPKTGSAYVYSYIAVGEFTAFVIGWNMLLEYVIGTASVARALSDNINSLANHSISAFFQSHTTITFSSDFKITVDVMSFTFVMLLTIVLCVGVRESSVFNNIFTAVNLYVVAYVTICGFFKYNFDNWNIPADQVPAIPNGTECKSINKDDPSLPCYGDGGFLPFGITGAMSGAATCFYAFVGFDVIATAGEEVHNPQRNIPLSIVLCLLGCSLAYVAVSVTITLICPYFTLDPDAPLTVAFSYVGWPIATYVISAGAICALSASMLTGLLPLPRVIFAMADDGVIFRWLASINPKTQTPLIATVISGLLSAIMAAVFDIDSLVAMMSIGTLLAYAIVAVSVTLLRYRPPLFNNDGEGEGDQTDAIAPVPSNETAVNTSSYSDIFSNEDIAASLFDMSAWHALVIERREQHPTATSTKYSVFLVALFSALTIVICFLLAIFGTSSTPTIIACGILGGLCVIITLPLSRLPESDEKVYFKIPFVPFLPCLSIFVNLYLMSNLNAQTWERFGVWMVIGFAIYFGYGVFNSNERLKALDGSNKRSQSNSISNPPTNY